MKPAGNQTAQAILTGQTERIVSVSCHRASRIITKILVLCTFLLLIAGALVTGNKAAMSDPTWPHFVGEVYPKYWVGGLMYEDSHRLVAGLVGIVTFITALVITRQDHRKSVIKLAWAAFILVIIQALFGALIIKSLRHPAISMAHGVIAQTFFCVTIALAVYCSRMWVRDLSNTKLETPYNKAYLTILKIAIITVFIQVVMGGGVRHSNDNGDMFFPFIIAHIAGAFAVTAILVLLSVITFHRFKAIPALRRLAKTVLFLLMVQIGLGVLSIFANRARLQPGLAEFHHVFNSTLHLLVGASILGLLFGTYLRARYYLPLPRKANSSLPVQSHEVTA